MSFPPEQYFIQLKQKEDDASRQRISEIISEERGLGLLFNPKIKIKIKKLVPEAVIPQYATEGDACFDLVAVRRTYDAHYMEYGTGLAMEIPKGYFGLIRPRSSVSKTHLIFKTSGIVDSGYRGEIMARFHSVDPVKGVQYQVGDRFAQMMILPYPEVTFEEVTELSESKRGTGGHGSTGS